MTHKLPEKLTVADDAPRAFKIFAARFNELVDYLAAQEEQGREKKHGSETLTDKLIRIILEDNACFVKSRLAEEACHTPEQPTQEWEVEKLSEQIHHLYCEQYEQDHGEPYWTHGDYSKLDERVKEYDRNIARFVIRQKQELLEKVRGCVPEEIRPGNDNSYLSGLKDGSNCFRNETLSNLDSLSKEV